MSSAKPTEVLPGVYALGTSVFNWYLVAEEGRLTAVDAGLPGFAKTLDADLAKLGFARSDIVAVVLTHSDADHTGMARVLQESGAQVLIGGGDAATLRKPGPKGGDAAPAKMLPQLLNPRLYVLLAHAVRAGAGRPVGVEGARTFEDGEVLEVPGRPRAIATPGHTRGHCALHFARAQALFVGDALCTWNLLSGRRGPQLMPAAMNESNAECLRSLDALAPLQARVVLPGHGEPFEGSPSDCVAAARDAAVAGR